MPSVAAVIKMSRENSYFNIPAENIGVCRLEQLNWETPEEAVIREVWEETGLKVQVKTKGVFGGKEFRYTYANGDKVEYIVVVFECEITSGKLKSIDGESLKLQYFSFSEKPPLALPYPDNIFL